MQLRKTNNFVQVTNSVGLQMVIGAVRARGIFIQRRRILDTLHVVDPDNRSIRRLTITHRRAYSVPGPNALWYVRVSFVSSIRMRLQCCLVFKYALALVHIPVLPISYIFQAP